MPKAWIALTNHGVAAGSSDWVVWRGSRQGWRRLGCRPARSGSPKATLPSPGEPGLSRLQEAGVSSMRPRPPEHRRLDTLSASQPAAVWIAHFARGGPDPFECVGRSTRGMDVGTVLDVGHAHVHASSPASTQGSAAPRRPLDKRCPTRAIGSVRMSERSPFERSSVSPAACGETS